MGKRCQQGDKKKLPRLLRLQGLGHVVFSIKPASEAEAEVTTSWAQGQARAGGSRQEAAGRRQQAGGRGEVAGAAGRGQLALGSRGLDQDLRVYGFWIRGLGLGVLEVLDIGFKVRGLEFSAQGLRVKGSGFVLGKSFLLDSLLGVLVLGKRFSLDSGLRVLVLVKRFVLDSLLMV